jgi:hypothetical protein
MKAYFTAVSFVLLTFSAFITVAQKQSATPAAYIGTWQLVSATNTIKDTTSRHDSTTIAEYKVITPNWFIYSIFEKETNTFIASTCGPLTIIGNKMTNTADYSSMPNRKGITNTYTVELKGKMMYQKGENGGTKLEEVWVKLY